MSADKNQPPDEASVLDEQAAYYRARAAEYDEWFYRKGRYDHGETENHRWFDEVDMVRTALQSVPRMDRVLELACGTGIWTRELVKIANSITAVDASGEMIELNRYKVRSDIVQYVQANIFDWQPPKAVFDMCFFGFWLSHVPRARVGDFLRMVCSALKPDGRLFMVDSRRVTSSTAVDHQLPVGDDLETMQRRLNSGKEYTIYKIFYTPQQLEQIFNDAGFEVQVFITPTYFIYASARKVD